jgi:hypothetical protein
MLARLDKPLRLMRKANESRSAAGGGCQLQSLVKMSRDAARSAGAGAAAPVETIGIA